MTAIFLILLFVLGLAAWTISYLLWRLADRQGLLVRLGLLLIFVVLYQVGLFLVLVGLGVDNWDDSSRLYWDSWLMLGSTVVAAIAFIVTRFGGPMRVGLVLASVSYTAVLVWRILGLTY